MAERKYQLRDPDGLNQRFYRLYDEHFLYNRARSILLLLSEREDIGDRIAAVIEPQEPVDDRYFESLAAELHFLEIQGFEALWALLLAIYQDQPHWLYLTTYGMGEMKQAARQFLDDSITELTGGACRTRADFVLHSVYTGYASAEDWDTNVSLMERFLERIATLYLDSDEYNAYKHGLRVVMGTGHLAIAPSTPGAVRTIIASGDQVSYLELREVVDSRPRTFEVLETTKYIDPRICFQHLAVMHRLLETIKSTRLAALSGEPQARLETFLGESRTKLEALFTTPHTRTVFTMPV